MIKYFMININKALSPNDRFVVDYILKSRGITPLILSAENPGRTQNMSAAALRDCAYFGNYLPDLDYMRSIKEAGGVLACPADADSEVKAISDYVCVNTAGGGALREFAAWLVIGQNEKKMAKTTVDEAVDYLKGLSVTEEDAGQTIVVNDDFYYMIQGYETKPVTKCRLESHRKYVDIQLMISGKEAMDLVDISRLSIEEHYNAETDMAFWKAPKQMSRISLTDGDCIVLYPEMAHRGAQDLDGQHHVLKIVGKVRVP